MVETCSLGQFPRTLRSCYPGRAQLVVPVQVIWLGGLDSNQDSQIQSLESYRLDDLPAVIRKKKEPQHFRLFRQLRFTSPNLIGN